MKALSNESRLQALDLLKDPVGNFPPQVDGDLAEHGVCANNLAARLGITPSTLSAHMRLLTAAGLVRATRRKGWVFYRRDDDAIRRELTRAASSL